MTVLQWELTISDQLLIFMFLLVANNPKPVFDNNPKIKQLIWE